MTRSKFEERLIAINNYIQQVNVTLSFIHIYLWDNDKKKNRVIQYALGKKVQTKQNKDFTPDILIQLNSSCGIVVELKRSLPKNETDRDLWEQSFNQLKEYDQELIGWFTSNKKIDEQDLILLIDEKLVVLVEDYIKDKNLEFDSYAKNFAIIGFGNRTIDVFPATIFRKHTGNLRAFNGIDNLFRIGITVSWSFFETSRLTQIKFTDVQPPIEYLMETIWVDLGTFLTPEVFDRIKEEGERRTIPIEVSVPVLSKRIRETYTKSESRNVINNELVKEALDNFVKIKYAEKIDENAYVLKWRTTKMTYEGEDERLKVFTKKLIAYNDKEDSKPKEETMDKFLPNEN